MNHRSLTSRTMFLLLGLLVVVLGSFMPSSTVPIAQAAGTITGNVFRDFNANGINDGANEIGVPGVTVTAYDAAGAAQGTATTATTGNYTLTATGTGPYRIEFTTLPASYYPGPQGTGSGSTVQFVPDGNSSNVNLGINALGSYGPTAPELVITPRYTNGNQTGTNNALMGINYDESGAQQIIATASQIGSTWGVAYKPDTRTIYAAAVLHRHAGFGRGADNIANTADDISSIYIFNNYAGTGAGTVSTVIDLNSFAGVNVGPNPRLGTTPANDLPASANTPNHDYGVFGNEGKIGIGDIDLSSDGQTLYVVNMTQQQLVALNVSNPTAPTLIATYPIPNPGCPAGDNFRPWALGVESGAVYVGGICDAATTQVPSNLRAYVLQLTGATFTPVDLDATSANTYLSLAYDRTRAIYNASFTNTDHQAEWDPWRDVLDEVAIQPLLSGIDFLDNGSMVLAFTDRVGLQLGNLNYGPNSADTTLYSHIDAGELRKMCNVGTLTAPAYAPDGTAGCPFVINPTVAGLANVANQVDVPDASESPLPFPGSPNRSFATISVAERTSALRIGHAENAVGAVAVKPGTNSLVITAMNPEDAVDTGVNNAPNVYRSGGFRWFNNTTGVTLRNNTLYNSGTVAAGQTTASFAKAVGLGDVDLLTPPAPIEIGNRVWRDTNFNGVQDAGELPIAGVVLGLYTSAGVLIDTVTTDSNGTYIFSSATGTDVTGSNYGVAIQPNTIYTVAVYSSNFAAAGPLVGLSTTTANSSGNTTNQDSNSATPDITDSDGVTVAVGTGANAATSGVTFTTGAVGANNHSLDFGYGIPVGALTVTKQVATTDGSSPSVAGNFTVNVDCNGAAVSPSASQSVAAGSSVTFSSIEQGSVCAISEDALTLPAAPIGYTWVAQTITPSRITIVGNVTSTVTLRNLLAPQPVANGVLTVTKTVNWNGSPPVPGQLFNLNIIGPSGYVTNTTILDGGSKVLTGLATGTYTVTESLPGTGWTTTYTVNSVSNTTSGVVTLQHPFTVTPVTAAAISGQAYRDIDADGVDDGANEPGLAGILVTAYGPAGNACGSTSSGATGTYSFTPTCTGPWRLEFSNLPSGYEPATHGSGNGTSTQFVTTSGATNINFGVSVPADYCQSTPDLVIACQRAAVGTTNAATSSTLPTLLSASYTATGNAATRVTEATQAQTGSIWGLASYDRNNLFSAALFKRHTKLGPGGLGAIYLTDIPSATPNATAWVTIPNAGTSPRVNETLPAYDWFHDVAAFTQVGKIGLGDIDLSLDRTTLYVINLNDKQLYAVPVIAPATPGGAPTAGTPQAIALPLALPGAAQACATADLRPFGLGVNAQGVWVSLTCTGPAATNLRGYIYRMNPATNLFAAAPSFEMTFNGYGRGFAYDYTDIGAGLSATAQTWSDAAPAATMGTGGIWYIARAQLLISDIDFDNDGDMLIGVKDRTGDQTGYHLGNLNTSDGALHDGNGAGDILRACANAALTAWTLESAGACGGATGYSTSNAQGPGGGEFYNDDNTAGRPDLVHDQIALGGLVQVPGRSEVVAVTYDPLTGGRTEGYRKLSNANGSIVNGIEIVGQNNPPNSEGGFAKASGLGDIMVLCDLAPIEIGNRVWRDVNGNGVQDPGEPGINGVTVSLQGPTGPAITTVTSSDGNYYFGTLTANTAYTLTIAPAQAPLTGLGLTTANTQALSGSPSSNNAINDTRDSDAVTVSSNATIYYTTGRAGQNNHGLDFGFVPAATGAVAIANTAPPRVSLGNQVWYDTNNNGVIDGSEVGVDGVRVELFLDANANGTVDAGEQTPLAVQNTTSGGYYLFTQTTDGTGVGTGTALVPGQYLVGIAPSNFAPGGVLNGSRSSGTTISNAGVISEIAIVANGTTNSDVDHADDGLRQAAGFYTGGVLSGPLALTTSGEPTGEPTTPGHPNTVDGTAGGAGIGDAASNLTVDFGFYRQTLGNLVFHDANNNGLFGAGETPLAGAIVKLYAQNGTTELLVGPDGILGTADDAAGGVTTGAGGTYLFQNLPQGQYVVQVTPPAGYTSSTDIASSANPNNNTDSDDNGIGAATGVATSAVITLTPGSTSPSFPNNVLTPASGTTANPTMDFGFYTLSLGNLVWNDVNNNGLKDVSEVGINGVTVNLYRDTDSSGTLNAGDTLVSSQPTSNGGHYLFSGLAPATYLVQLAPSNFQAGGALVGYASSTGTNGAVTGPYEPVAAVGTIDNDDNGTTGSGGLATAGVTGGIVSGPIPLAAGTQPIAETDLGMPTATTDPASNANSNLTIDFGVFQSASLGDFVWNDADKDGVQDAGELGINGVLVSLYTPNGKDGIAGNADDTQSIATTTTATNGATQGYYHFANLTPNTVYTIALDRASDFVTGGPLAGYTLTGQDLGGNDATDSDAALVGVVPTISATTGGPGTDTPTYDFGFNTSASLGDYVWLDSDNDGIQDVGETGINGVTVSLYDSTGTTLILTTTTTTNGGTQGYYHFANLVPATAYVIRLDHAADFVAGGPLANTALSPANTTTDTVDSDATLVGSVPTINATTGGPGSDTPTFDTGFYRPSAALGDYVWNDVNTDGVQGAGEPGINGVTVHLYTANGQDGIAGNADDTLPVATTTTATNGSVTGYYHFANLIPNTTYTVKLDNPADYATGGPLDNFTLTSVDQGGNDATDSDATVVSGFPTIVSAPTGADNSDTLTYDFGFYQPLSLGNLVWNDTNNNGLKDASESGIDGVTVNLYSDTDSSGTLTAGDAPIANQLTTNGGHYLFTNLAPATYLVQVDGSNFAAGGALVGYRSSTGTNGAVTGPYEPGTNDATDNDDNGTTGSGGLATTGVTGGIVSGPITLVAGTQPTGETDTTLPTGITDSATDINSNLTIDFGVFQPASLGDYVWIDANKNGVQDASETGVNGVQVSLFTPNGADGIGGTGDDSLPVATTTTATNGGVQGYYHFANLTPNTTYTIQLDRASDFAAGGPLAGYTLTDQDQGGNDATDSDAALVGGVPTIGATTGAPGSDIPTYDFGFYQPLSLGNLIWNDLNNNGLKDASELGIDGVTVNLYRDTDSSGTLNAGDALVANQPTSNGGHYLFTNLGQATYFVQLAPANFVTGGPLVGYTSSTGTNGAVTGPYEPGASGATDNDDNGTIGTGGLATNGIVSGPIALAAGTQPTTETDLGMPTSVTDPASNANSNLTIDFGVFQPASLGDFVWIDTDKDGVQDAGELGVNGVQVSLYTPNGKDGIAANADDSLPVATTTTATNGSVDGYYHFANLTPNTVYTIALDRASDFATGGPLAGYTLTGTDLGGNDATDSDATLVGSVPTITNATTGGPGTDIPTYDFGFSTSASLGDYVWLDADNDGIQDVTETGINGVTVHLYDSTGTTLLATTTTATNGSVAGYYHFANLIPNTTYVVKLDNPADFATGGSLANTVLSPIDAGGNDTTDSDAALVGGFPTIANATTGGPGSDTPTYDIGVYRPAASLGDYVWNDADKDGVQDASETGINGVTVHLYDGTGTTLLATTTTATNGSVTGYYHFANLIPNTTYVVKLDLPADYATGGVLANYALTVTDQGGNDATDSDASLAGGYPTIATATTGADGSDTPTYDIGFYQPLSLGNLVWNDVDNNGVKDASELGIDGVTVNLYIDTDTSGTFTAGDTLVTSQTTSNGGHYLFTDLGQATYFVQVDATNFATGGPLFGYTSSTGAMVGATGPYEPGATTPDDDDDNGTANAGAIVSGPVVLVANTQPIGEDDTALPTGITDTALDASSNLTIDFGVFQPASLGDYVWNDADKDGIQDAGEIGINGVTVNLYTPNGKDGIAGNADDTLPITTTTTFTNGGSGGYYHFADLNPNTSYTIALDNPTDFAPGGPLAGTILTGQDQGGDDTKDSDATLVSGYPTISATTGAPGSDTPTYDFGVLQPLSLGNLVWNDVNNNGLKDASELGIDSVTVNLYQDTDSSGTLTAGDLLVGSQLTSNGGHYLFTDLGQGTYLVQLAPTNFQAGGVLVGYGSSTGTNGSLSGPYEPVAAVGTTDNDDNGTTGVGGPATGGIVSGPITLTVGTQPTAEPDTTLPTGITDTALDASSNLTIDFGVFQPASLGDFVWNDTNKNGAQDGGESGIDGVTVSLYDGTTLISSTVTAGNGAYHFVNLTPNMTYTVKLDNPTDFAAGGPLAGYTLTGQDQGGDDTKDSDAALVSGVPTINATTGAPGSDTPTYDFGFSTSASLGDFVWYDADKDGVQDAGEPGINGVTVNLYDATGTILISSTLTAGNGGYHFADLMPNTTYTVKLDNPADFTAGGPLVGYTLTGQNLGGNDATDSDAALVGSVPTIANATTGGPGSDTPTYDFGFNTSASLGDFIWNDTDKDGVQDAGELGINGVTVNLYDATGTTLISSTLTAGNGAYHFANLTINTTYTVKLDNAADFTTGGPLAGYTLSPTDAGGNDATDSDATLVGTVPTIANATTGGPGSDTPTYDIGFNTSASLGDFVWHDTDKDGVQDAGEPGINGVTVNLYDATGTILISSTLTAGNGGYHFANLVPNTTYTVKLDNPADFTAGGPLAGYTLTGQNLGGNDATDSDAALVTSVPTISNATTGGPGSDTPTYDFGFNTSASLGDFIWNDTDKDGVQDAGEPGINGVTVNLYDATGTTLISSTVTAGNGAYHFVNLTPNTTYTVKLDNPADFTAGGPLAGYTLTGQDLGGNDATDSDATLVGTVPTIANATTGGPGSDTPTYDIGFNTSTSLGDFVWHDTDKDGVQDAGEPGINGVTVNLYDATGTTLISSTLTAGNGGYHFANLVPNTTYTVKLDNPADFTAGGPLAGYTLTGQNLGGNDATDSDAALVTSVPTIANATTGGPGTDTPTYDFGFNTSASLGDFIWNDTDKDGVQDAGEPGINGVTVNLYDATGTTLISSTLTAGNGGYHFANLVPNTTYVVKLDNATDFATGGPLAGYTLTGQDLGGNDATDSDAALVGSVPTIASAPTSGPGTDTPTYDIGFFRPVASLGDFIWNDTDQDGVQDAGEPGINGVTVNLYDATGTTLISSTLTAGNGDYHFANLTPNTTYTVKLDNGADFTVGGPLAGYTLTGQDLGGNDATDSDAALVGSVPTIANATTGADGSDTPTYDIGLYQPLSLGNLVWNDLNNNGLKGAGELGIDGVTVNLYIDTDSSGTFTAGDTLVTSQTTSNGGHYLFTGLRQTTYFVQIDASNFATGGPLFGYGSSTGTNGSLTGPYEPVAAVGVIDNDDNGTTGVGGTATDGIVSGPIILVAGTQPTGEPDATLPTGITDTATDNNSNLTIDFGVFQPASLGDYVWIDTDRDGVQDSGEVGVNGVLVSLYTANGADGIAGNADDSLPVATTTTATNGGSQGYYHFANLTPNTVYTIALDRASDFAAGGPLAGYTLTGQDLGGNDATDSDAALVGSIPTIANATTGGPGSDTPTYDFGFNTSASLGDFVWNDTDKDGVQDAGEPGINGVTVNLYDATGTTLISSTVTAGNGAYHFANLLPNTTYTVKLDNPTDFTAGGPLAGYTLTGQDLGGNDATDSDAALVGSIPTIANATTGGPGSDTPTYDIGFNTSASLGDFVWHDTDKDGVQDVGEPGINGVTVNLYDATGTTLISSTVTAGNGSYHFANLVPNTTYTVKLDNAADFTGSGPLAGYTLTGQDLGGNDATDSDAALVGSAPTIANATTGGPGSDTPTYDIGFNTSASLGDFVWHDTDKDGVQDAGEPGINGVTVNLYDATGTTLISSTVTAGNGGYHFANLVPNTTYVVKLDNAADFTVGGPLAGYALTGQDLGGNDATDSDAALVGTVPTIGSAPTGGPGTDTPTYDIGFYLPVASLGDFVWNDTDKDGMQDAGEPGINGVTVNLYDATGTTLISSTLTAGNGGYHFANLVPNTTYTVKLNNPADFTVGGPLAGYTLSPANAGGNDATDSDATLVGTVPTIANATTGADGSDTPTYDIGWYIPTASLGDFIWNDTDKDGVQDAGEPGINGVTVNLYDATGTTLISSTLTAGNGAYHFTDLTINTTYTVKLNNPADFTAGGPLAGYTLSPANAGGNDATDSDATLVGTVPTIANATTGADGSDTPTYDIGFNTSASLGDFIWNDANQNGVQDVGEPGINGVTVRLYDSTGTTLISSTLTAGNGDYHFVNLTPNTTYTVKLDNPADFTVGGPLAGYTLSPTDAGANDAADSDAVLVGTTPTITGATTGGPGSDTPTYDIGFSTRASLGDFIWNDTNKNGVQDAGEVGINGVTVNLYDAAGTTLISSTLTAGNGAYHFANLTPNTTYTVKLNNPADFTGSGPLAGYTLTGQDLGGNDATDSDAALVGSVPTIANATTAGPGSDTPTYDIGFFLPVAALGDFVWNDVDHDGVQDVGEPGINGVTVNLYDATGTTLISSTVTAGNGAYHFANLTVTTTYTIKLDKPADYVAGGPLDGFVLTPADQGGNDATDSDATVVSGYPTITAVTGGDTSDTITYDAGLYQPLSLGNLVWNDLNNNGVQDAGEPGIDSVTVNLYVDTNGSGTLNAGDTLVTSQPTSNGGHYLFSGLVPATYLVQIDPTNFQTGGALVGYGSSTGTNGAVSGPYEPGTNNKIDNDDNGTTGTGGLATTGVTGGITSGPITLAAGTQPTTETDLGMPTGVTDSATNANSNLTIDFGVFQPASLGDYVWIDTDRDGVQDVGEVGVNGVQVSLYTPNGKDGIAGNADDLLPVATTTTATNGAIQGYYHFANLTPSTVYTIALDRASDFTAGGPLAAYTLTSQDAGGNDATDSDAALVAGVPTISAATGGPGSDTPTYDFGFNTSASLGDYIWLDADNDGVQDTGETGINGVTVHLYDSTGTTLIATTTTTTQGGIAGYYHFANLDINTTYVVKLDNAADFTGSGPLANTQLSPTDAGGDDTKDSDAALVSSTPTITSATTGGPGSDTPTYDIGFYRPAASLGDYVWNDTDKDGVQDAGETGINGVTVHLYDSTGTTLIATTTTATNGSTTGYYHFANLVPNTTYVVKLDNPADYAAGGALATFTLTTVDQGGNDATDSDATMVGGFPTITTATTGGDGSDTPTYDIGFYQPLSLGNLAWNDRNNNGLKDASEVGIDGVTVNLYADTNSNGTWDASDALVSSQTTSNGGHYLFTDLGPATYFVALPASNFATGGPLVDFASSTGIGAAATGPYEPGATGSADNDDNGTGVSGGIVSGPIVLAAGTQPTNEPDTTLPTGVINSALDANSNLTVDFGVFMPASLGSVVWNDVNGDGVRQPDEPGVPGVTVTLYDSTGTPIATTTTDANGQYVFTNLVPDTYTVGFTTLPPGSTFTTPNAGGDDSADSDVDSATGRTDPVSIEPGENDLTIYAGIVNTPTAITLTHFGAAWQGTTVVVQWTTSSEIGTFGFHLLRSSDGTRAHATRVTPTMITAQGRGQGGAAYTWTDTTATGGQTYTYWLEETEVDGTTNVYGPTTANAPVASATYRVLLPLVRR